MSGATYAHVDRDVAHRLAYYYLLEAIDLEGNGALHGPVCVDWDGDGIPDDQEGPIYIRGDANGDGWVDITDMIRNLGYQFGAQPAPGCLKTADVNDDGGIDLGDPIFGLGYLFADGAEPPALEGPPGGLGPWRWEAVGRREDGAPLRLGVLAAPLGEGRRRPFVASARDIATHGAARQALQESEERFRAMVEAHDGFIYVCSRDHHIEYMNIFNWKHLKTMTVMDHLYIRLLDKKKKEISHKISY